MVYKNVASHLFHKDKKYCGFYALGKESVGIAPVLRHLRYAVMSK